MGRPGRIPPSAPIAHNDALEQAWECAECGWSVRAPELIEGWSIEDARDAHAEKYCARPPIWSRDQMPR